MKQPIAWPSKVHNAMAVDITKLTMLVNSPLQSDEVHCVTNKLQKCSCIFAKIESAIKFQRTNVKIDSFWFL